MTYDICCEVCGKFISYADLDSGNAVHRLITPDSEFTFEEWETLCVNHYNAVHRLITPDEEQKK
jgi:hypothetical protein